MSVSPALDRHLARTCWHLVAHRSEVRQDRDYVRLPWVLGDLVVYNDRGTVIAFDNLCPHRGTRLFLERSGNAPALCPYHGWSYRGGRMRIPRPATYDSCEHAAQRLNAYELSWCGDFLFAAVAPEAELVVQLGEAWPILEDASRAIGSRRDFNAYTYECPWRVAVENALEPDHVHFVHSATLDLLQLTRGQNRYFGRNSLLQAEIGNARTVRALGGMEKLFRGGRGYGGYMALYVFPFAFLTSTFGYAYSLQNFLPSRVAEETHFSSRLLATHPAGEAARPTTDLFLDSVVTMNRQVFAEDHEICRRIDPGFDLDLPGRLLSSTEEKVRHFRGSLAEERAKLEMA